MFVQIVDPLEVRNDFFVTIEKGKFAQDAMRFYVDNKLKTDNKKQQKNLEITVRLVDFEGRDVEVRCGGIMTRDSCSFLSVLELQQTKRFYEKMRKWK